MMASGDDAAFGNESGTGNGSSILPGIGSKGKYERIDAELANDRPTRGSESKRYVFVCAVFASLNSVLLGYGEENLFFLPSQSAKVCVFFFGFRCFWNDERRSRCGSLRSVL